MPKLEYQSSTITNTDQDSGYQSRPLPIQIPITDHQSGYQSRQPFLTTLERPPMTIPSTLCRFLILNVFEHFSQLNFLATSLYVHNSFCFRHDSLNRRNRDRYVETRNIIQTFLNILVSINISSYILQIVVDFIILGNKQF